MYSSHWPLSGLPLCRRCWKAGLSRCLKIRMRCCVTLSERWCSGWMSRLCWALAQSRSDRCILRIWFQCISLLCSCFCSRTNINKTFRNSKLIGQYMCLTLKRCNNGLKTSRNMAVWILILSGIWQLGWWLLSGIWQLKVIFYPEYGSLLEKVITFEANIKAYVR